MYSQIFFSRNVGNSIKYEKNIFYTPPPPPKFEIQNQNKGIEDIIEDIMDSNCPYLLFGETTWHLTSKWRGNFQYFYVENSIKREMRKNCFSKKKIQHPPPPPPRIFFFFLHQIFFLMLEIAWNAWKRKHEILKKKN